MNKTFQNIIDTFEYVALSGNSILKSFNYGLTTKDDTFTNLKYPSLFVDISLNTHTYENGKAEYVFDLWFGDLLEKDESNRLYIISDMIQIGFDFVSYFDDNEQNYGFYINKEYGTLINFEIGTKFWADGAAGIVITVSVIVPEKDRSCKNIFD